jgi:hypothetical protein
MELEKGQDKNGPLIPERKFKSGLTRAQKNI